MTTDPIRRKLLKAFGIAVVSVPAAIISQHAAAMTNPELRAKFKYQDKPLDGNSCTNCVAFQQGKTDKDLGKCTLIPGDDEISPQGYCSAWYTM